MNYLKETQGTLFRALPLVLAMLFSGCATIGQDTAVETVVETAELEPPVTETTRPASPPQAVTQLPGPFGPKVAIVLSSRLPAYESVAIALGELLEDYSIYDLADKSQTPRELFTRIDEIDTDIVMAVGLRAATVAKSYAKVPVVFCQVFNVGENNLVSGQVKGVAALPPLSLQVEAWQELNPGLQNIGAILGSGHELLIEEAHQAADSAGLTLHYRIARSDRETLYLFNRLTPDIDGFWLFPDNRVLSPAVLRQIIQYAARHRVQVAVFNPALLDLGATLSATSVDSDIAATVVSVARRVIDGDRKSIPDVTPLNEIKVQMNPALLSKIAQAAANGDDAK